MSQKGFETNINIDETLNFDTIDKKPLGYNDQRPKKVDINVLKARAKEVQDKENRKNIFIFVFFLVTLAIIGIYFSI